MDKLTEEQLEIIERLVKYTLFKSMNELKYRVKYEFTNRGWKEALKHFKLKRVEDDKIAVYE